MPTNFPVLLKIETNVSTFERKFKSASHFYRQLSNSKMGLSGGGKNCNREFWSRHVYGGIYYFIPFEDGKLQMIFLLDMKRPEKLESIKMSFRARIKRLLKSISVIIQIEQLNEDKLLQINKWLQPFVYNSQIFGSTYKEKINAV